MVVRQLKPEGANEYWRLRLRALKECPEAFGAAYEEEKDKPLSLIEKKLKDSFEAVESEFMLGCFDEEQKLIGMVCLVREHRKKLRHKATIYAMYVAPEARLKGAGRALLMEAIGRARKMQGLEQLNLGVIATNMEARALYRSCGFEVFGVEKNALKLPDKYLDEELMTLFL